MAQEAAYFADLDAEGVEAVKLRLLARGYASRERVLVQKWLSAKDRERIGQESQVQALHAREAEQARLKNAIAAAFVIVVAVAAVIATCAYYFDWVHH
jgi:hypothetical protein